MSIIGFVRPLFLRRVRSWFLVHFDVPSRQPPTGLRSHSEARARLDQVAGVLVFDDNAAFRRVGAATAAVNQESRSAAHVVGRVWVQNVAVGHALESHHVAQAVLTLRKGADGNLALAAGVVSAAAGLARASFGGIDRGTVEAHAFEVVGALGVGIGASSLEVTSRDLDLVAFLLVKNRDRDEENEEITHQISSNLMEGVRFIMKKGFTNQMLLNSIQIALDKNPKAVEGIINKVLNS